MNINVWPVQWDHGRPSVNLKDEPEDTIAADSIDTLRVEMELRTGLSFDAELSGIVQERLSVIGKDAVILCFKSEDGITRKDIAVAESDSGNGWVPIFEGWSWCDRLISFDPDQDKVIAQALGMGIRDLWELAKKLDPQVFLARFKARGPFLTRKEAFEALAKIRADDDGFFPHFNVAAATSPKGKALETVK